MSTRSAQATWTGPLQEGQGKFDLLSSGLGSFEVSFPSRTNDASDGQTSAEELLAAALCSCFVMQLSSLIGEAGGSPEEVTARADVRLSLDPSGGFRIDRINLAVSGHAHGVDRRKFGELIKRAKETCPVSKALRGTTIHLETH